MKLTSIPLDQIQINDSFWSKHIHLVREKIIPYQWEAMNDRIEDAESSHCIENFKIAANKTKGAFYGAVFQDTDVAKWLEAVGFTLACYKDETLMQTADEVIDLIAQAQSPDGYINTYFTIKEPTKRWANLCEGHELYTAGHLMEAAVAYYNGTGKRKLLDCLLKFADLICDTFGIEEDKIHGYPGHQEIEIGLIKLYDVTGDKKYLDTAKYFIDARGQGENYFLNEMKKPDYMPIFPELQNYEPIYSQSHMPVRKQETAEGHAVRAVYMYCAMADLGYAYKDEALLQACKTIWDNMTQKRMYITGSIGSSGILERFTTDYDLPNGYNYSESCASIGLALFGLRMAHITKEASYIDVVERALYNTVLAGIALDGQSFFYVNPLEVWPDTCISRTSKEHVKPIRQKWFGVACCPPNIARTLASLGQYIWAKDNETVYLNLFVSNQLSDSIRENTVSIEVNTKFPIENAIEILAHQVPDEGISLAIRIPAYAKNYTVQLNQENISYETHKGYAIVPIATGDKLNVTFDAAACFVRANPLVREDIGKVAIVRGPLVYCLEEIDNGSNLASLYVDAATSITEEYDESFATPKLIFNGKKVSDQQWNTKNLYEQYPVTWENVRLSAIPYAYWCNRSPGEMTVWIKELLYAPIK